MKPEKKITGISLMLISFLTNISCSSFSLQCANCSINNAYQDAKAMKLLGAVVNGDTKKIEKLISEGANPNYIEDGKVPLLIWAICANNLEGYEALLKTGADPNLGGNGFGSGHGEGFGNGMFKKWKGFFLVGESEIRSGWSATVFASAFQNTDFLRLAIQYGGDLNSKKGEGAEGRPLIIAAQFGQFENVKLLIESGADINIHDEKDSVFTAPRAAIIFFGRYDIANWLLDHGYNYDLSGLSITAEGRVVNEQIQPEKEKLIKKLEMHGIKFPIPGRSIETELKQRIIPEKDIKDIIYGKKFFWDYPKKTQ